MQNRPPEREAPTADARNVSMSDDDRQKTVANPSPGEADPGNAAAQPTPPGQ